MAKKASRDILLRSDKSGAMSAIFPGGGKVKPIELPNGPSKLIEGVKVIDTDTHVTEPADLWTSRVPEKWRERVPVVKRLGENSYQVSRDQVEQTVRNPAALFSQAQIQPQYDGDAMIGMQINSIKPGSLFEEIGIESGDVITELNGIQINSPEESARILSEFTEASQLTVVVEGEDGPRTLNYTIPEE